MAKIRKRGNSYQIDYFDPTGKRIRKSFSKKKGAEAELGKRVSLIAEGRYLDVKKDHKTTLNELIEKYTENYQHQAIYRVKNFYLKNFREYFGEDTLLYNIRYVHLETYRNHLKQKPITIHISTKKDLTPKKKTGKLRSIASVSREMSCLRHIFKKAVEWEMIEQSPFDRGKSLLLKENNKRMRFLTEDEIKGLLIECPAYLKRVVECALNTGMRKSEILRLKWDQIRNGFIYLSKTKNMESRQIPINDDLDRIFKQIRKEQHLTSPHVFLYNGNAVQDIKRVFNNTVQKAGIQDFRFHDLRHTFASQVIMRGGTLKDVQELLGHKTMTMTLRYAHLTQEHKRNAVNLLNGLTTVKQGGQKEGDQSAPLTALKNGDCHKTVTFPDLEKCASM